MALDQDWLERGLELKRMIGEEPHQVEAHIYAAHEYARMKAADNPFVHEGSVRTTTGR